MVSELIVEELSGQGEKDTEGVILDEIHERKRVSLQALLRLFVKSGKMSKSTLHRHLRRLREGGEIKVLSDGKQAIYCVPGFTLPERQEPSEIDEFLVEEMKKLVSDMLASGLVWVDEETEHARWQDLEMRAKGDERMARRYELSQRAYSLFWTIQQVEERRTYKLPVPAYVKPEDWEDEKYDVADNWTTSANCLGPDSIMEWLRYFVDTIDHLTRELAGRREESRPSKKVRQVQNRASKKG